MHTELTEKGWKEVVTTHVNIIHLGNKDFSFDIEYWLDFNKRHPSIGRKRKSCNCCKKSWTKLKGKVNLVFTDKGNKSVCDDCYENLQETYNKLT